MGLSIESILMGWEFWVPPIVWVMLICIWILCLSERVDYTLRKACYMAFAVFEVFFHGVHETSFFDIALVISLVLVSFSFFDSLFMMYTFLAEFFILFAIQFGLALQNKEFDFDKLTISRIILHIAVVLLVYSVCVRSVNDRRELAAAADKKDKKIEAVDSDMEDFLSNISHELRTPVNVVNGMSEMMIKRNAGEEAFSIKTAGIRLAYQIEDIQDYTECKRKKVILEEDDYMSISLVNDVVTSFRLLENDRNLELIVDLDPSVPAKMWGDVK